MRITVSALALILVIGLVNCEKSAENIGKLQKIHALFVYWPYTCYISNPFVDLKDGHWFKKRIFSKQLYRSRKKIQIGKQYMSRLRKHILRKIVHNNCKLYLGHVTNCVLGSQSALECMVYWFLLILLIYLVDQYTYFGFFFISAGKGGTKWHATNA